MKKILAVLFFLSAAVSSFPDTIPRTPLYITGEAERNDHLEYILGRFTLEAARAGYSVVSYKEAAAYTLHLNVTSHPYNEKQYIIHVSYFRNTDDTELLFFNNLSFSELEEINQYTPLLYTYIAENNAYLRQREAERQGKWHRTIPEWQNKWLYARASLDYPVTFYDLQSEGLIAGAGVYYSSFDNPIRVAPIDNKIIALPGITLGGEVQFLNFLSFELNFLMNFGAPQKNSHINFSIGTDLKFPLKLFNDFLLEPYAAALIPLNRSPDFNKYPPVALGGGIQLCARAEKSSAFFIDIKYLFSIGDAVMKNPYGDLYPEPKEIHYKRSMLTFALGYKYGFFDRNKERAKTPSEKKSKRASNDTLDDVS